MANHLLKRKQHSLFTPYDVAMSKKDTKWGDLRELKLQREEKLQINVDLLLIYFSLTMAAMCLLLGLIV